MSRPKKQELKALLADLTLYAIQYYAVSAEVNESPRPESERSDDVDIDWGCKIRVVGNEFGARLRAEVNDVDGRIVVDVAAEYRSLEDLAISRELAFEFVNEVAVMQLLPFVRETVISLSAKVFNKQVVLPIHSRGEVAFSPDDGRLNSTS